MRCCNKLDIFRPALFKRFHRTDKVFFRVDLALWFTTYLRILTENAAERAAREKYCSRAVFAAYAGFFAAM